MANRLESRVSKLEQAKSIGKNGIVIFCKNVKHKTIIQDNRQLEVIKSGDFYTEGSGKGNPMSLEQMREYLAKGKYQAITLLPLRNVEK